MVCEISFFFFFFWLRDACFVRPLCCLPSFWAGWLAPGGFLSGKVGVDGHERCGWWWLADFGGLSRIGLSV